LHFELLDDESSNSGHLGITVDLGIRSYISCVCRTWWHRIYCDAAHWHSGKHAISASIYC